MEMLSIIISLGFSMKPTMCCRDIVVNRTESDQNSQNLRYASTYLESLWSSVEQPQRCLCQCSERLHSQFVWLYCVFT